MSSLTSAAEAREAAREAVAEVVSEDEAYHGQKPILTQTGAGRYAFLVPGVARGCVVGCEVYFHDPAVFDSQDSCPACGWRIPS